MRIKTWFKKAFSIVLIATCIYGTVYAVPENIQVNNALQTEYNDFRTVSIDFNNYVTDKEVVDKGTVPYEILGPLAAYAIIYNDLTLREEIPSQLYTSEFLTMLETSKTYVPELTVDVDISQTETVITESISILMREHETIMTKFETLKGIDLYTYAVNNSNHIYNVMNSFLYIYNYNAKYSKKTYLDGESIVKINERMDKLYEMYNELNQQFGKDDVGEKIALERIESMMDIIDDNGDLHPVYLRGIAVTSTFIPFMTNAKKDDAYKLLFDGIAKENITDLKQNMTYYKPLYGNISKTSVEDTMSGQAFSGKPITLQQFLDAFKSKDMQITLALKTNKLRDKTLNTIIVEGKTQESSIDKTPKNIQEPLVDNQTEAPTNNELVNPNNTSVREAVYDAFSYTEPVYIAALLEEGEINSKNTVSSEEKDYLSTDKTYTRAANFNYALMYNLCNNVNLSQNIVDDLNKPLCMDIFGNILTESGIVILPSIANALNYSNCIESHSSMYATSNTYNNHIFPENATFKIAYPYIDNFSGQLTTVEDTFSNKFTFATLFKCIEGTEKIENLNYFVKFMDAEDLKVRRKGWTSGEKVLSTTKPLDYPSFPLYPYFVGDNSNDEDGTLKQMINKGSFNNLNSKNSLLARRVKENQQYVLNLSHILLSDSKGNFFNSNSIGFNPKITRSLYELNKYYLIMDKETKTLPSEAKHNGTLRVKHLQEIALQCREGSKDVNEMLVGEELSTLNFAEGDKGFSTATIASWGESIHFSMSNSKFWGNIMYVPNITELPFIDRILVALQPILVTVAVLGLFGLVVSWGLLRRMSFSSFITKTFLYFIIIGTVYKLMPAFITLGINKPVELLYNNLSIQNTMLDLEVKEKNIKTAYFKGFSEIDTTQHSTSIVLAELTLDQYRQIYEMTYGGNFYTEFKFLNYINNLSTTPISDNMYIQGNKLCMSVDSVFKSSAIQSYDRATLEDASDKEYITPMLKQYWYDVTELHYFTPYHLMTENLIHTVNTVTVKTNGRVFPLVYGNTYKITGFVRNYMKSNYYLKSPAERMKMLNQVAEDFNKAVGNQTGELEGDVIEDLKDPAYYKAVMDTITSIDLELKTNQDFLGIMKWSGIHTNSPDEAPFGANVIDDIALENEVYRSGRTSNSNSNYDDNDSGVDAEDSGEDIPNIESQEEDDENTTPELPNGEGNPITNGVILQSEHSIENTYNSIWYNNPTFFNARKQLQKISESSVLEEDEVDLVVNGKFVKQLIPIKIRDGVLYVFPQSLVEGVPGTNYTYNEGSSKMVIYTPSTVVELDFTKTSNGGVAAYSNGSHIGFVKYIEEDGVYLIAINGGSSLINAVNADMYYNADYKTAIVFYPECNYVNALGELYEKVLKVNQKTRTFMDSIYRMSLNVSDENMLKSIALVGTLNFNKEFSTMDYPLYPKSIDINSLNIDMFTKQLFISDADLARSAQAQSLYSYTAKRGNTGAVVALMIFEIAQAINIKLRDFLLAFHTIALPILFILYYIFSNKFFYKPWLGTLISYLSVAVVNFLTMLLFRIPDAMTANSGNDSVGAIIFALAISLISSTVYVFLWKYVFKDLQNLGFVEAKGALQKRLDKIKGRLQVSKKDSPKNTQDEDEVVSDRVDALRGFSASKLSAIERYQSDIDSNVLSSRLAVFENESSADDVSDELSKDTNDISLGSLSAKVNKIVPTSYADLSIEGAPVTTKHLRELSSEYSLQEGKDYISVGQTPFITNSKVINEKKLPSSYLVTSPYSKELVTTLNMADAPYQASKDMVRYISKDRNGIVDSEVKYVDGKLTVPINAVNPVKNYLNEQKIGFKQYKNVFDILQKERFDAKVQAEVTKLSKPLVVKSKIADTYSENFKTQTDEFIVSPNNMEDEIARITEMATRLESRFGVKSAASINSNTVKKMFKPEDKVFTYTIHLDKHDNVKPLVEDIFNLSSQIESTVSQDKSTTLRTADGVSVVFGSEEDYKRFKSKFEKLSTNYFVTPTVAKKDDNYIIYTLSGDTLTTKVMTKEEFSNSEYSLKNCKYIN